MLKSLKASQCNREFHKNSVRYVVQISLNTLQHGTKGFTGHFLTKLALPDLNFVFGESTGASRELGVSVICCKDFGDLVMLTSQPSTKWCKHEIPCELTCFQLGLMRRLLKLH